jgi:cystathionine gamma-synthase
VVHSVTYHYKDLDAWHATSLGQTEGYIYSRNTNPTVKVFEEKVRALEESEHATSFATGMAAISNTLFAILEPGDRVVSIKDTYGGTSRLFLDFLPRMKVEVTLCETTDHEALEAEVAKGCKILYLETPTNPTTKILDLERLSAAARKAGALTVVDNTFATPVNQQPLKLGADLVVHSATKFLGGHSDALGGVLCGSKDLVNQVFGYREITGATLHPMSAYLLLRGLKTLPLRIERQNSSAMTLARYLTTHEKVESVFYPGLEDHPGHDIAKKQMSGFGGMLSFSLKGGYPAVKRFLPELKLAHLAASLGAVGTLAGPPRVTSHVELTAEQRELLGIPESLVRYSVGIENVNDLIKDIEQAFRAV